MTPGAHLAWINRPKYGSYLSDRHYQERVDRKLAGRFDFAIGFVVLLLVIAGVMNLYSAVYGSPDTGSLFTTQLRWVVLCAFLMIAFYLVNYQFYEASAYWMLGITCLLLLIPLIHGL
jgi:cell division protein FtsW (lipid II flippase)